MTHPLVSIVLPTRNGMPLLLEVVHAVAAQRSCAHTELIAIDTASTDGTLDLLRTHATQILHVEPKDFDHGTTRNRAIEATRGELVVILSQDAVPVGHNWLDTLTKPLLTRPQLAATFCRQQPRPGAGAITRYYHSSWAGSSPSSRTARVESLAAFERLAPLEQMATCTFDNVCSCIRRDVWAKHPFRATSIAEDLEWAKEVLLAGYEIEYVADAVVCHSHDRSATYELTRTALLHQRLHALFGVRTIPSLAALVRAIVATTRTHLRCRRTAGAGTKAESLSRALALAVAWPLGQYVGGLAAARGWRPLRSRRV